MDSNEKLSRRQLLRLGALGAAGLACASAGGWWLWRRSRSSAGEGAEETASIFAGDAPDEETWQLFNARGWVKEAYHYRKLGRTKDVQCLICPNACVVPPGGRSHCRDKVNRDGVLYTLVYGNPCSIAVDPVEKKPLYHFLPGSKTFSFGTAGCVLRCLNCQNWTMSQSKPEDTKWAHGKELRLTPATAQGLTDFDLRRLTLMPEDAVAMAVATGSASISYTYSEPVAFYEYTLDTCKLARERGIRNIMVTCGSINDRPLRELAKVLDGAHVDLKGFDEKTYRKLNSGSLAPILHTLKTLAELNVWFEIINLVVPTWTDDLDGIKRMSGWLVKNIGPDRPIHFSRFHPMHKLTQLPQTSEEKLVAARKVALAEGLRYVYIGNVPGLEVGRDTLCPGCGRLLISRTGYVGKVVGLAAGQCGACKRPLPGVWK